MAAILLAPVWGFFAYNQHFATFMFFFSVWVFEMESNTLLDLPNSDITITGNSLFCGGEHRKRKFAASISSIYNSKMAMFI